MICYLRIGLIAILVASSATTTCFAGTAPAPDFESVMPKEMVTRYAHARWSGPPSQTWADAYPREAQDHGVSGVAIIVCYIALDGSLKRCDLLAERPRDYGFGKASVGMYTKSVHVDPATVDGGIHDGDFKVFTANWEIH